jgi:hypothetical protein
MRIVENFFSYGTIPLDRAGNNPWGTNDPDPFVTHTDETAAAYWTHVDTVISAAKDADMLVLVAHAYAGYGCFQGWAEDIDSLTTQEAAAYGAWVADRYESYGNVLWLHGGDVDPSAFGGRCDDYTNLEARIEDMYDAIRTAWPGSLHAGHPGRRTRGSQAYTFIDSALEGDLETTYDACDYLYDGFPQQSEDAWNTGLPYFMLEGRYNAHPQTGTDACLRSQTWWPLLGGGVGATAGSEGIWCFDGTDLYGCSGFSTQGLPWRNNLSHPGIDSYSVVDQVTELGIDFSTLVPDWANSVGIAGRGSQANNTYVAVASNSLDVVAYTPDQHAITFDFTGIGEVDCKWIDAATGAVTDEGSRSGASVVLTPPSSGDWVLLARAEVPEVPATFLSRISELVDWMLR